MGKILKTFLILLCGAGMSKGWASAAPTETASQNICGELKHMELSENQMESARAQIFSEVATVGPTLLIVDYQAIEKMLTVVAGVNLRRTPQGSLRYWTANAVMEEKYLVCFYGIRQQDMEWGVRQVPAYSNIRSLRVISEGETLLQYFAPWVN